MSHLETGDIIVVSGEHAQAIVSRMIVLGSTLRHQPGAGDWATNVFCIPLLVAVVACLAFAWPLLAAIAVLIGALLVGFLLALLVAVLYSRRPRVANTGYSHSAIVYGRTVDGTVLIQEAVANGVQRVAMHYPADRYRVVRTSLLCGELDGVQLRAFLDSVLAAHERYGRVQFAGLALYCITGTKLCVQWAGTSICSGLCCNAGMVWGAMPSGAWDRPPYAMMPDDIAVQAAREGVEIAVPG